MNIKPVINLIQRQAALTPDNTAIVYDGRNYTYSDVMAWASGITQQIREAGLAKEDVVGILIPRDQWLGMAPVGVLAAGCAYMPLDPAYPAERLNFMLSDSHAKLLIADRDVLCNSGLTMDDGLVVIEDYHIPVLFTDTLTPLNDASAMTDERLSSDVLALLIYTSGSTGQPKGCMIEQRNISCLVEEAEQTMVLDGNSRVASYSSFSFVPTVHDIFGTLATGGTLYIIPEDVRFDFVRLAQFINDNAITHIIMSTMTGAQFVTTYECPTLRCLSVGGEKLNPVTPPSGLTFLNVYGSSECCGMITCHAVKGDEANVPIGKAPGTYRLYVVDEDGQPVADGEAGELWVSGPQLCRGYLNHPELTATVFIDNPFNDAQEEGYERVFRTGDFVRRDAEGRLLFAGRRDGLVKIRGFRVELREVEAAVLTCPGVTGATLQSASDPLNGTYIVAYVTGEGSLDGKAIKQHVADLKPAYMVPEVVIQLDKIPRNNNGKVDRERLPKPKRGTPLVKSEEGRGKSERFVPENDLQRELHEIVADVIGTDDFGLNTPLSLAGMTSVSAIKVCSLLYKKYGVNVDARKLVACGDIGMLEQAVGDATSVNSKEGIVNSEALATALTFPLTSAQTGVFVDQAAAPDTTLYNLPGLISFSTDIDTEAIKEAVVKVVGKHPLMNAVVQMDGSETRLTICPFTPQIEVVKLAEADVEQHAQGFIRPFSLYEGPLYRFEILATPVAHYLLMDIHHLIFDGSSFEIFLSQLCRVLDGLPIEDEGKSYAEYALQQGDPAAGADYFGKLLKDFDHCTLIPSDSPAGGAVGSVSTIQRPIDMDRLAAFCRQQGVTPASVTLAAVAYTLARYSGERCAALCTVSSGRAYPGIADTTGMFVNTLPLYVALDGQGTVENYLWKVNDMLNATMCHEDYPFAKIAADYGFNPETAFVYQIGVIGEHMVQGHEVTWKRLSVDKPKFRLEVLVEDDGWHVDYDNSYYTPQLMQDFAQSLSAVLERFTSAVGSDVLKVSVVDDEQERRLAKIRQTATGEVPFRFFHECISHFAQEQPEQEALVACDATYTYKEMDELTNRIANGLLQRGVKSGDRVALLLPRTSRLILSMFGVLKAGAAYIPCDPDYPADRVKLILEDSEARFIITTATALSGLPAEKAINAEELLCSACCDTIATNITGDDLAYLIYTSGSTGRPKGVMLRHEGICNYLYGHPANVFANAVQTDATRILSVTTISFDAALQDIGMAYYNGKTLILATEEQANNPLELAQLIREQHIDMVSGTPSRWQTWLTSDDFCQAIGGVRICRAGGEKYPQQLLDQLRSITKARLFNCYGPTEITVASNNAELTHASLITVGKPQLNVKEYIVDGDGNELPVGVVGELYIGGKGVARGYNNLDEMTRERFVDYHGERIYKSGDYAKWLPDGNVVILGRTDHQIKLRGLRIELGEVESAILQVDGVKQVVVTIRQIGGMEHLCAYFTADREIDTTAMRTAISSHLTDYMVPTAYMQLDHMPMTPNGKTDIKALPDPQVQMAQGGSGMASSRRLTRIEKELQGMITEILGIDNVDVECPLGMVGLTSLSAIRLAILIQQRYGVTLQAKKLVKNCTLLNIEDEILTAMLSGRAASATSTTSMTSSTSSSPLSYAQTGVYFDCLKNPTAIQYNIPHMVTFPKDVDANALAEAVKTLVGKHPQLTAHFEQTTEGIVQTVNPEMTIDIVVKTMSEDELQQYKHDFVRPFDLVTAPLCRFEIVTTQQAVSLLFDVHHLVFDGASNDIFFRQLCRVLDGSPVEDEAFSYSAYVLDEKAAEDGEDYQKARDFFNERLSVVEAATEVRPDLPNPVTGTVSEAISSLDIEAVDAFCRHHQLTPAHLTLAAVYYALSRFANSEQVCITTVSNGRSDLRIRSTVGMFVNTLAMTATIGKQSVSDFLHEVSTNFDETLSHENYPFAQIAADYGLTPEIQFVCQLGMDSQYTVGGMPLKMEILGTHTPKFPITFFIVPANGIPSVCVAYDNGKYSARLMQSLADAVKVTVERMIAKPDAALTSISIVSDEEAQRIIKIGTGKEIDVDLSKTFANLFTEQAKRTPDAPAVVDRDSRLTYGEMDRYSNALARQLIDFGVQPNDFVCVMLDRFKEFPLAVLAIHKAGAAYTPLDFEYPNERLSYMLENSESKVLITSHDVLEAKQAEGDFSTAAAKTFFIDDFMADVPEAEPIDLSNPDGLAYMIYTSGSTGKPKGAMLHQAGLRNFIAVVIDMEKLTADDRISGHRSFSFDAHIEDMYPVLTLGGSFHIMPTEIRKDLAAIRQFLIDHQCTGGGYSTAMTSLLLNTFDDLPIRFTTGGGEKMDGVFSDHIEIINVYGPTECTDDTSYYSIAPGRRVENIPIGQSVANNWNFIVDTAGNLVPQGVAGELCFAGVQVGRGYWRLPERTAKSFVDCPFVKQDRWGRPVRMYHTGDLCRWNEDGQIEYMGRIDTQVKLRGFRIELGEIESKALNIEGIRQAAAEVRKVMGNEHLVLYYTVVDGSPIDSNDIAAALKASSLADYMVPDAYMLLEAMPMTPNGKINRKALPAPEMKRATEYEAPKGEKEELFCSIFSDILKIKEVGATDNFFEIGGTSINAIKVIVEASKHGVQIVFNDLFNFKTPRALAAFVDSSQTSPASQTSQASQADPQADSPESAQFAPLNALLCANTLDSFREGERQTIGDVLLTGATGYLGIHILHELLTNYHGKILCPVRARSATKGDACQSKKGNDEALSRIKTLYFYYFGRTEAFSHFDERVSAFVAEVTQPDGLDSITQQGLTVVNCVANVKHFSAGNDIEMVNIESVRHLISFCLRTSSRLIHISTNSIAGISVDNVPGPEVKLTEQSFYIGQNVNERKYTYSKFKAEELVLDAIAHHGLNAKIMRVGNLSARQKDGEFQINFNTNNFLALLRAFVVIGMVPYEKLNVRFEFSPIDEVARAVMLLAQTPEDCVVFHPYNTHQQFLSDVLNGFAQAGISLRYVESEEFSQRLSTMMDNPDLVTLLRPLMAYNLGGNRKVRNIECTNDYTTQVLYRLGFQWPPTAADYVHRFVDTIMGFDYFTI